MSLARQLLLENSTAEGVLSLSDEKLEKVFREIEEASERRALEEEEEAESHPGPLDPLVSALANNAELALARKRRRQSISVSRVGSYADVPAELHHSDTGSGPGSPVPWAPPPPLYRANTHTSTTSSLSTNSSFASSHERHHVEETHTTQKETIAARRNTLTKAMSSALSKTLTRMRSRGAINEIDDEGLVIAVHEARTETTIDLSSDPASPEAGGGRGTAVLFEGEGARRRRSAVFQGAVGGAVGDIQVLTRTHTKIESRVEVAGRESASEPGPSRRMSITLCGTSASASASVAGNPSGNSKSNEVTRSRSGSINKLRGKRSLRGQSHAQGSASADVSANTAAGTGIPSGTGDEGAGIFTSVSGVGISSTNGIANAAASSNANTNVKASRRISYFAKALAQRLRKRKSGEESEKDKDKENSKSKDRDRGKEHSKSDRSSQKSSEKTSEGDKQTFVPPEPIYVPPEPIYVPKPAPISGATNAVMDLSQFLDQPILKSPLLVPHSPSPPPLIAEPKSGSGGKNGTTPINTNTLPPSPRRLPSASEIPLPSSPAGSPRSTSSSNSLSCSMLREMKGLRDAAMVPLPPSPITSSFTLSSREYAKSGYLEAQPGETTAGGSPTGASIPIPIPEGKRKRLPPSALPDADFGPMGEVTPAPTPSPTESTMSMIREDLEKRKLALNEKDDGRGGEGVQIDVGPLGAAKCEERDVVDDDDRNKKAEPEADTDTRVDSSARTKLEERVERSSPSPEQLQNTPSQTTARS